MVRKRLQIFRFGAFGGDKRDRTADLLNAIQALSQLSYTPMFTSLRVCASHKPLPYHITNREKVKRRFEKISFFPRRKRNRRLRPAAH